MSLAPARSRGAFLKARLAVNGIQCAARSLGTLTAAGRGLLSSIGGLFWSLAGGGLRARYLLRRTTETDKSGDYLSSIGRFEGAELDVQGIDEARLGVVKCDLAV